MKIRTIPFAVAAVIAVAGFGALSAFDPAVSHAQSAKSARGSLPLSGTWTIDNAHTNANFGIRHFGISTVRGRFDEVKGSIVADERNPERTKIQVTIPAASISTGIKMRDDHLRSADFFDVEKYPTITFESTRVQKKGSGYVAHGNLTMHGVTRAISMPFKVNGPIKDGEAGARIGTETKLRINRQDYGIKYGQVMDNGSLAIGNDVDITISLEATSVPSS